MNNIYAAKNYFEEMLLGINNDGLGFINESSHGYFKKSINNFLGSNYSQDKNFSDDVISVGLLTDDLLEVGISLSEFTSNAYCEYLRYDICQKLSLPVSRVRLLAKAPYKPYNLQPGHKVANKKLAEENGWGTLGGMILPLIPNVQLHLISNSHVLANCGIANVGDPIYNMEGTPQLIGNLKHYTNISSLSSNTLDLAVAELPGFVNNGMLPGTSRIPSCGDLVYKVGARTGLTYGVIRSVNYTSKINFPGGNAVFVNQIQISSNSHQSFSQPGDSGSFIRSIDNAFVGLLFAGNGNMTFANHPQEVHFQLNQWGYNIK